MLDCHNYRAQGYIAQNCRHSGSGAYQNNNVDNDDGFPGDNGEALRRPPRRNKPRALTLMGGRVVKWHSNCGVYGSHLRADHPANTNANIGTSGATDDIDVNANKDEPTYNPQIQDNVAEVSDHTPAKLQTVFNCIQVAGIL